MQTSRERTDLYADQGGYAYRRFQFACIRSGSSALLKHTLSSEAYLSTVIALFCGDTAAALNALTFVALQAWDAAVQAGVPEKEADRIHGQFLKNAQRSTSVEQMIKAYNRLMVAYADAVRRRALQRKFSPRIQNARKVVSVYSIRNFKFLGFALGKGENGVFIRAHAKSLKKAKAKLKKLTSRSQGRNVRVVMQNVKVYIRGWLGYFGIARMKNTMQRWDEWLRRRFRAYIWKQWKVSKARIANLMKLGIPKYQARKWGYVKGYWRAAGSPILKRSITNERLALAGYYSILNQYESMHLCD